MPGLAHKALAALRPVPLNTAPDAVEFADGPTIARRTGAFVLAFAAVLAVLFGLSSLFQWDASTLGLVTTGLWLALWLASSIMIRVEGPPVNEQRSYWGWVLPRLVVLWLTFIGLSLLGILAGWEPWTVRLFGAALFVSFTYEDILRWVRRRAESDR